MINKSIRIAGDSMDSAISSHIKRKYNLMIGERSSEDIKIKIGSADKLEEEMSMTIKGRDLVSGLPKTIEITSEEIREALQEPVNNIIEGVKALLERTPPELAADIMEHGITMVGGGSLLKGFDKLLASETGLQVKIAEEPEKAVVLGTGMALDSIEYFSKEEKTY